MHALIFEKLPVSVSESVADRGFNLVVFHTQNLLIWAAYVEEP